MEKINDIIVKIFKISPEDAAKNLGMADVAKWDSLTHMDLIVEIENSFSVQFSGDDIAEMTTFDAIRTITQKYLSLK